MPITDADRTKLEQAVHMILEVFDDPSREGLIRTPERVASMYEELLMGQHYSNQEIASMFDVKFNVEGCQDLVLMKDIDCFSLCEHHLALMYNMKVHVAYIPDGKVIGLSKIARIVDMVSRRLQLQERIAKDIAEVMELVTESHNVMVIVEGEHSCMTARGIKKPGTSTKSSVVRGLFDVNPNLRNEVYALLST